MLFNSLDFLIFFPIVILGYFALPRRLKNLWLLLSSYFFYMCWNAKYLLLILISTLITYLSGLAMERIKGLAVTENRKKRKKQLVVAVSCILNLGILFYFKYFNFALDLLQTAFSLLHIELNIPAFDILLPVGISFYTFQALSYTIDVYRGDIYAEKNFITYALFVSFFPQLVAGPIERSKNLLRQLSREHRFSFDNFRQGVLLMLWGFFLKIVVADRIALFVDTVYGDYATFGGLYIALATILFAVQIYCDFGGYSIIAMGAARVLDISLMENFKAPYLSRSVAEFWRNWHISLTSWFRDYLYIPLGGSRKGKGRKFLNKLLVFLASGLWHGADLSFVFWGLLNGFYQIAGEVLAPVRDRVVKLLHIDRSSLLHRSFQVVLTFLLVDFSWLFFRSGGLGVAVYMLRSLLTVRNFGILFDGSLFACGLDAPNFYFMLLCIGILLVSDICRRKEICIRDVICRQAPWVQVVIVAFSIAFIMLFGMWGPSFDQASFIYFQF